MMALRDWNENKGAPFYLKTVPKEARRSLDGRDTERGNDSERILGSAGLLAPLQQEHGAGIKTRGSRSRNRYPSSTKVDSLTALSGIKRAVKFQQREKKKKTTRERDFAEEIERGPLTRGTVYFLGYRLFSRRRN